MRYNSETDIFRPMSKWRAIYENERFFRWYFCGIDHSSCDHRAIIIVYCNITIEKVKLNLFCDKTIYLYINNTISMVSTARMKLKSNLTHHESQFMVSTRKTDHVGKLVANTSLIHRVNWNVSNHNNIVYSMYDSVANWFLITVQRVVTMDAGRHYPMGGIHRTSPTTEHSKFNLFCG